MPEPQASQKAPSDRELQDGLRRLAPGGAWSQLVVEQREAHVHASTNALEIVSCRLPHDAAIRLACKYYPGWTHPSYGHRGGIPLEAQVYEELLGPHAKGPPACHGYVTHGSGGWLCLEHVGNAQRINMAPIPDVLARLGGWLGALHLKLESIAPERAFLPRHDATYYTGWAQRTLSLTAEAGRLSRTVEVACEKFTQRIAHLASAPLTLVHGELYPHNVLVTEERSCPVDWESAACAAGEIDLASLTQGWPAPDVQACETAYRNARWPEGIPAEHEERLALARMYWHLRWLGEKPEWTRSDRAVQHVEGLERWVAWDPVR